MRYIPLALFLCLACSSGNDSPTGPSGPTQANIQLLASSSFAMPNYRVIITLRESAGVGVNVNYIRIWDTNGNMKEYGSSRLVNEAGGNRVEANGEKRYTMEWHYLLFGSPVRVLVNCTDDRGVGHNLEATV